MLISVNTKRFVKSGNNQYPGDGWDAPCQGRHAQPNTCRKLDEFSLQTKVVARQSGK